MRPGTADGQRWRWPFGRRPVAAPRAIRKTQWVRRVIALGVFLLALGAVVLAAKAVLGGSDEPAPVAKGPKKLKTEDVVIPEGLTIAQIADVAKKAGLKGDYEKAVDKAAKSFPLKKYDASDAANMEGFLFPATYEHREERLGQRPRRRSAARPSSSTSTRSTSSTPRRRT